MGGAFLLPSNNLQQIARFKMDAELGEDSRPWNGDEAALRASMRRAFVPSHRRTQVSTAQSPRARLRSLIARHRLEIADLRDDSKLMSLQEDIRSLGYSLGSEDWLFALAEHVLHHAQERRNPMGIFVVEIDARVFGVGGTRMAGSGITAHQWDQGYARLKAYRRAMAGPPCAAVVELVKKLRGRSARPVR